jgi:glutaminyl-tRNA synthetase
VRLRYACIIKCQEVVKDAAGEIVELKCTWDPDSVGGQPKDGRKIKGTIHWVSEKHALDAEVRLYDRLFTTENPLDEDHFKDDAEKTEHPWLRFLNPKSLEVVSGAKVEPSLRTAAPSSRFQFERVGYFCVDERDSKPEALVFNRTIQLKDGWTKKAGK